jgi:phospholipid N-methyltransferase
MEVLFELDALSHAKNYQKWMFESVEPYLGTRVLELGAGIGNMSQWITGRNVLVISELESAYVQKLKKNSQFQVENTHIVQLDLSQTMTSQLGQFELDTIVSFNVLEHIEDDFKTLKDQVELLRSSKTKNKKRIVIFVPAIQFAFGEFDRTFKHYRRYHANDLRKIFRQIDPNISIQTRYFNYSGTGIKAFELQTR